MAPDESVRESKGNIDEAAMDALCASWRQELGDTGREALLDEVVSLRRKLEVIELTRQKEGTVQYSTVH